ncbi:hypothetical protein E4U34_000500 [Claviceps purpurea]|nr:hypothetical protein E4U34_000500 [Claviceps purpurea]
MINYGVYQHSVSLPDIVAQRALCYVGEDVKLELIRIRGADFDSNVFRCLLVDSKPYSGVSDVPRGRDCLLFRI